MTEEHPKPSFEGLKLVSGVPTVIVAAVKLRSESAVDHPEENLGGGLKSCFGMSMATPGDVLSKGQRLPLPIRKTLTNPV